MQVRSDSGSPPAARADAAPHPRTLGWLETTALAMGGINQSLFLIGALIAGQGAIPGQGSAAVPLLIVGLVLAWMAAPGWTELVLMWPGRVGGVAATCAEAFRPISPVLANLAGTCYWWGWVPTCGLTALLSASAIHQWYLPHVSVPALACGLVFFFTVLNLRGVQSATRLAVPIAAGSAALAFLSGLVPVLTGHVDWHRSFSWHLTTPFAGPFGKLTSAMAGLYLVGFAAPAFEAVLCHVGETRDPARNVPRAMFVSAALATVYFALLPLIWLGALGPAPLSGELALTLGPTFAPLLGGAAKAAAIWFMMLNMFHGTLQPLAGAARTLSQLAEDGLLPLVLARRSRTDAPWVATLLTAGMAIAFLMAGDPIWLVAATNLTYLIGISLPSVAVWLLRRSAPAMPRPWRAPNWTVPLGLAAAAVWGGATVLGFEQFGLPTVLFGMVLAFSGPGLYALRRRQDRRRTGEAGVARSLHAKLTGAMLLVMALDGAGYLLAISHVGRHQAALTAVLADIFVGVALLTISVGLVLPGMIGHAAAEVARAADRLAAGTLADFSRAMEALGRGDLDGAHARVDVVSVVVHSRDEVGAMADSFNVMQDEVARAAAGLDGAREGLHAARRELTETNAQLRARVDELRESRTGYELAVRERLRLADDVRVLLDCSGEGIYGIDQEGNCTFLNRAAAQMTGYAPEEALGRNMHALIHHSHADGSPYPLPDCPIFQAFRSGRGCRVDTEILWRRDGTGFPAAYSSEPIVEDGEIRGAVVNFVDITERRGIEREREQLLADALERADRDPLTGLLNHRAFHKRLDEEADRALRAGTPVAVAMMDLDNFKFFNDAYGHQAGDDVLRQVARALLPCCRSYDTLARFGGDELALLMPGVAPADFDAVTARLLEAMAGIGYRPPGYDSVIPLSLSVGVAAFPDEAPTRHEALELADVRLRRFKMGGAEADEEEELERLRRRLAGIEGFSMLDALVTAVDNKDRYTRRHSEDVLTYCLQIAHGLGLDDHAQRTLRTAALLHDVGKIGVPDRILRKPGQLTEEEFAAIRHHPMMGAVIVGAVPGFEDTLDAVRHHHERWDGGGYPFGLVGEECPLMARLMAVADAFSAMTTNRPYRQGMAEEKALAILEAGAGTQWDPTCVQSFLRSRRGAVSVGECKRVLPAISPQGAAGLA